MKAATPPISRTRVDAPPSEAKIINPESSTVRGFEPQLDKKVHEGKNPLNTRYVFGLRMLFLHGTLACGCFQRWNYSARYPLDPSSLRGDYTGENHRL